ncbi:Hemolysin-3 like protein [Tritrichomonas foetus]|uniref:Hemolysin-3 like protein n=1 Tax=Tritrichomonas foetus TaxID=1144522 RepID=A0A1J4KXU8_9EUKA|nr:Hemolysin-3 like protein [Tritrichomonas foetus]|eukprot:OHT14516.1 Hemolysin-3 like protein [Tritrichomonas foetus]
MWLYSIVRTFGFSIEGEMKMIDLMSDLPPYSQGEEICNALSHFTGFCFSLHWSKNIINKAKKENCKNILLGRSIFCITMIFTFLNSTIYHGLTKEMMKIKIIFRYIDHTSVFLHLIGTASPFVLQIIHPTSVISFILVWVFVFVGIIAKIISFDTFEKISTYYYVSIGFIVAASPGKGWFEMNSKAVKWFFIGSFTHLLGVYFYSLTEKIRYTHFVFHIISTVAIGMHTYSIGLL